MVKTIMILLIMVVSALGMELSRVADNIYMAKGGYGLPSKENRGFISNAYGVLTREGWVIVDTLSTPELAR